MTSKIGGVLGGAVGVVGQANTLLGGAIQALILYRQARDAWKAAHPAKTEPQGDGDPGDEQPTWLEDADLIDLLAKDSATLSAHAGQLLAKYAPAEPAKGSEG